MGAFVFGAAFFYLALVSGVHSATKTEICLRKCSLLQELHVAGYVHVRRGTSRSEFLSMLSKTANSRVLYEFLNSSSNACANS